MLGAAAPKSSGAGAGKTTAIRAGFSSSPDSVWTSLDRAALRGRQRVEHLLNVLDAVLSDLQSERRGPALEAPVAAADGAGSDEALALEAAIPLEMGAALRVAPVDHQRVAQARHAGGLPAQRGAPPPSRAGSLLRVQALHRYRRHRPLRLVLRAPALGARSAGRKTPRRVPARDARRVAGRAAQRGREKSKQNPVRS